VVYSATMQKLSRLLPLLPLGLLAAACASYNGYTLRPGVSTEAEVRGVMGRPAVEFLDGDGTKHLTYPRGPLGTQTYVADVRADGVLAAVRPVLNDDTFNAIRPGMTRDEILRLIGPPGDAMSFALSGQDAWDYRYTDTWGYRAVFSVTFDRNGIVVSKFSRRLERDQGRM
jgi:hypothetical protein